MGYGVIIKRAALQPVSVGINLGKTVRLWDENDSNMKDSVQHYLLKFRNREWE